MQRVRMPFNLKKGYLLSKDISYECGVCGASLPSIPLRKKSCVCGNITISLRGRCFEVKNQSKLRVYIEVA